MWQIDNIAVTVHDINVFIDRHITNRKWYMLSNSTISGDLEWPSRSFTYCVSFQMRFSYNCAAVNKISPELECRRPWGPIATTESLSLNLSLILQQRSFILAQKSGTCLNLTVQDCLFHSNVWSICNSCASSSIQVAFTTPGWRRGVVVTTLVVSTKLLYVEPG